MPSHTGATAVLLTLSTTRRSPHMPTEPVPQEPVAIPADPKSRTAPTRRTFIATGTAVGTAVVAGTVLGTDLLSESEAAAAPRRPPTVSP